MKAPFPLVEVIWLDAASDPQGWEAVETMAEVAAEEVWTVGFLVKESANALLIASSVCKEKTCNSRMTIPRGMVKSMRYLRGKPKAVVSDASA